MEGFIYKYFIEPIWAKTGYNIVNTTTYAMIALLALYLIFLIFRRYNVKIDKKFVYAVIPFILLGSTVRVVTDAVDAGIMTPLTPVHQLLLDSHIYDYGYLTVSPGIYMVIAAIMFLSMAVLMGIRRPGWLPYVGLFLWLPHFLLLIPFMKFILYAIPIIIIAVVPFYIALRYFKNNIYALIVGAHALDGGATFFIIDFFGKLTGHAYFEQHVVGNVIGQLFGTYAVFYLLKVAIAFGASYILFTEKELQEDERNFIALAIVIMGLAPGLRDILRMVVGA